MIVAPTRVPSADLPESRLLLEPRDGITVERPMMGGRVLVHLQDPADPAAARRNAERVLDRIVAWANRLTRFDPGSELSRLNAATTGAVPVGPSLSAVLDWARTAETMTEGIVDVAMLDARLAAEFGTAVTRPAPACRRWSLVRHARGSAVVREPGVRLDLDGVAKGWLADRSLGLLAGPTGLVDADGDIAARLAAQDELLVGVADPRTEGASLAVIRLAGDPMARRWGLATSGISVHRWSREGQASHHASHHLIDPATWRPARTDIVQATVLADSARVAEAFAKVAVIVGSERAAAVLDRPNVHGALLLTADGDVRATPGMVRWLA